ncbi:shikimate dehydrogenase [Arenibacter sp. TNZ]|jgi:shikimate dehydrogenase|uniref:shikimate dehydrogenase family protein n=1 Tax=Arenibacter TaxID=178469 RepID=UPI000CD48ECB|nr:MULTISPECIES: shikimate dehydrogenase [Arenibacter]MCM4171322.1 shikimate dehydrogenase [Arenibacter sp. TNZ]
MGRIERDKYRFGLIGKNISYSFSRGYFTKKFSELGLDQYTYVNFDLEQIDLFKELMDHNSDIKGFNVTIPYKEQIMPFLSKIDKEALAIGAVNTIKIVENETVGYNTDVYGFQKSIEPYLRNHHTKALILGTGGASKAVAFVLNKLGITHKFVSRSPAAQQLNYSDLSKEVLLDHTVIVNCTPLGTYPNINDKPDIPYNFLSNQHLLFDLIYNPEKTAFLLAGEQEGAEICNGANMLQFQAEKSWEIWNS